MVGPLDYFFLKKVVKRLELTWITFPTVVLVVSAAAYFTAYWLKGSDLHIRKLDVVDIDLAGQTVGHTWFTLFSPRISTLHHRCRAEALPNGRRQSAKGPNRLRCWSSWMNRPELNRFAFGSLAAAKACSAAPTNTRAPQPDCAACRSRLVHQVF